MAERRRRVEGGRKDKYSVRFSEAENALLVEAAGQAGLTVPHLIAETVLLAVTRRDRLTVSDRRALSWELAALRRLLKAIGNNLNQMARVTNATGYTPGGLTSAADALARAIWRLEAALGELDVFGKGDGR